MEQNSFVLQDKYQLLNNYKVQCVKCGKISKEMPPWVYSIVAGLCPEADSIQYTYNCECGHKQDL